MSDQQNAGLAYRDLAHATAGRLTTDREILLLDLVAEAWSRGGKSPYRGAS
jgi:hypothetical protein